MSSTLKYSQTGRPMVVKTPLGKDDLLLVGFSGREEISRPFVFQVELIATNFTDIPFDRLLSQKVFVTADLPGGEERHFHGVVRRISQGARDDTFTRYRLELVPQFWTLTKHVRSRIFQQKSVVEILKEVLTGLDVAYEIQGTFEKREFCVQYRESDFDFASRLMEEEGIYYFFKHTTEGHKMILANTPQSNPDVVFATLTFEDLTGGLTADDRVRAWEKTQEIRAGKVTLWDHCFELPNKHLEAEKLTLDKIKAGKIEHKLKLGNDSLELYDYPGGYAKRFDGITKSGGEQPASLQKIFQDNGRTAGLRMQEETTPAVVIQGQSDCRQLTAGHKFTLEHHFNADGKYLLTSVEHRAVVAPLYRSGMKEDFSYENVFTCIPADMPFRPESATPKPRVEGAQTATVVGPSGEEIFTDKYSRVKVQFPWDREGKNNADSSCWVRVATIWAGKQWGAIYIPRVGQEVVVDFLEGDPDRPVIVGSVYNADMMPPYTLPANRTQSGIKSRSSTGGGTANFNEIRFEDKKGSEQLFIHAEKDSLIETENDKTQTVGHDRTETVDHDEKLTVKNDRTRQVDHDEQVNVKNNQTIKIGKVLSIDVGEQITIKTGASQIVMKSTGAIEISGVTITINGKQSIENKGVLITSEASGIHTIKGSLVKIN